MSKLSHIINQKNKTHLDVMRFTSFSKTSPKQGKVDKISPTNLSSITKKNWNNNAKRKKIKPKGL
jgi:hypothetical protein